MLQILVLIATIVLLIGAQLLRALLARVFPTQRARAVAGDLPAPAGYADLYREAHAELTAIGFEGPAWYLKDSDPPGATTAKIMAAYRNPRDGAVFCLIPGGDAKTPNRLNAFVATRLADGRVAISQACDPYFALTATADSPARTVAPATLRLHYEGHRGWIAGFGVDADRSFAEPAAMLDFVADWHNRKRDELIARGDLRRDADGLVRARLGFALRMLVALLRRPKPPKSTAPTPAARLAGLAATVEQVRERVPPPRVQWTLFGASALAFAALGAWVWSPRYAVLLLLVIGIHELGHYLAMLAFGYRNVHMLALPLVGGVTIGHEVQPSAARRAWMSLMGPLPGILIGWILLLLVLPRMAAADAAADWLRDAAMLFLAINYLNLLPVPPLDGARVVQALLPPRWHVVQAGFLAVTCVIGAAGAGLLGFTGLAMIALLQLTTLPIVLQNGRALRLVLAEGVPPATFARPLRLRRVLDALERTAGPARQALARINQAEAVLRSADQPPMRWWQRTVLGIVLAALLVVPVGAAALFFLARPQFDAQQAQKKLAEQTAERGEFERRAQAMTLPDLVRAVAAADARGADDAAIQAAQARLGQDLPGELATFYRSANGIESEDLVPVERIARAEREPLATLARDGAIEVDMIKGDPARVALDRAVRWIRLSAEDAQATGAIYYDAEPQPAIPGHRVIRFDDDAVFAEADLRGLLVTAWSNAQQIARMQERMERETRRQRALLRDTSVAALVDAVAPPPNLFERIVLHARGLPPGVGADALAAASLRLGEPLPGDLALLYRRHDGVPSLQILQIEWLARADAWPSLQGRLRVDADSYRRDFDVIDEHGAIAGRTRIDPARLQQCIVVGAWATRDADGASRSPSTWWCPARDGAAERWITVLRGRVYPDFHALLVDAAASQRAARSTTE